MKHFESGGRNMSFMIKNDVLTKYNEIWKKIKKILGIKFHSQLVYDEKYIKAKIKEFSFVVNTNFLNSEMLKEGCALHLYSLNKY